jgi:Leucine-rich repeat (LRR) protein
LYVQNNFLLSSIDVSGLNKLEKIDAENNKIETVMLTKAPQLKYVNLKNNLLSETVEIRELANLEYFNAECCNLLYINFSSIVRLKEYYW